MNDGVGNGWGVIPTKRRTVEGDAGTPEGEIREKVKLVES